MGLSTVQVVSKLNRPFFPLAPRSIARLSSYTSPRGSVMSSTSRNPGCCKRVWLDIM
jgi:hypothetical protein